jgi:hypothetical protein
MTNAQTENQRKGVNTVRGSADSAGRQAGSVLVGVVILAFVMLTSCLAVLRLGAQDAALAVRDVHASQSFFLAESGLERGETWLRAQSTAPTSYSDPLGGVPDSLGGGAYSILVTANLSGPRPIYQVTSLGTADGHTRVLQIDLSPRTYTDYLYFVNRDVGPGSPAWFCSGDTVHGPVHANDQIGIRGDPVFEGPVETGSSLLRYHNDGTPIESSALANPPHDNPTFEDGLMFEAPDIPWLDQGTIGELDGLAGLRLNGGHEIVFGRSAGTSDLIGYVSYRKTGELIWTDVPISSFNGIISVNGDCIVSGVVDGQVTVVSGGQISIVDDLLYHDRDENGPRPGCDDIIGLVAGSKVVVAETPANRCDCEIHAQIIAVNNQACLVERYDQGSPRGTLTLHGGIAQDKWGPVGTGYLCDGRMITLTGYKRDFHYDWRLRRILPPGYSSVFSGNLDHSTCFRLAWRDLTPA